MATKPDYYIVGGESRERLFAQLLDIGRVPLRPPFRVTRAQEPDPATRKGKLAQDLTIIGIKAEDGSGDSWIIYGYSDEQRFRGLYNTRTRTGWVLILR